MATFPQKLSYGETWDSSVSGIFGSKTYCKHMISKLIYPSHVTLSRVSSLPLVSQLSPKIIIIISYLIVFIND